MMLLPLYWEILCTVVTTFELHLFLPCASLLASLHVWEYVCMVSLLDFLCTLFLDYFMMGYGLWSAGDLWTTW